jgi:hypothetical protein
MKMYFFTASKSSLVTSKCPEYRFGSYNGFLGYCEIQRKKWPHEVWGFENKETENSL